MLRKLIKWTIVLLIVVAICFLIWRYTRPKPIEVALKPVTRGIVESTVANTRAGSIKACRRARLSPSIGGQISKLPVKEGDQVKKGQLLLELWNQDLTARAVLAKREVVSARSRSRSACLKAEVSQRDAKRLLKLRKSNVVSEERTDKAVAEAAALKADCQAARTQVSVGKARLAVARANLERTRLLAPFDGVIAEINGELFEYVTPSPVGVPTPPAVDIIDNACFYVTAPIDEVDAGGIRVGMTARITIDAFADRSFKGKVRRIADYVLDLEKQARTVDVEVVFGNPGDIKYLLAGYSADIEVILDVRNDVVRVPTEAVMEGLKVYVFLPDQGKVVKREIRAGLSNWDQTEVLDGLGPDELVVVNVDNPGLKDGAVVVRIEEKP
ncbi:MAG: efflux RND transporter periplasmic adaptor subunit [Gemmatimonadota bacterium]|nr:efflux RND transporter periplasmic adaptor subunit [Gemmatimonadota bacterium]